MKKIVAITLLFTSFWGCNLINPGTCPDVAPFFDITGFVMTNTEDYYEEIPEYGLINFSEHRFDVAYDYNVYAQLQQKGGFFSQAYALSCLDAGYEGSKELIEDIIVTTNFDINDSYSAGDTITDLMMFNNYQFETSLNDYLNQEDKSILSEWFWLNFMERPTATDTVSIDLTIILDNGESYNERSEPVIYAQ